MKITTITRADGSKEYHASQTVLTASGLPLSLNGADLSAHKAVTFVVEQLQAAIALPHPTTRTLPNGFRVFSRTDLKK